MNPTQRKFVGLIGLLLLSCGVHATEFDENESAQVLVFGGTGRLGSDIVKALVAEGLQVTVFARESSNRDRLANVAANYVTGDVLIFESVVAAFDQQHYDVVIDALGRGSASVQFYETSAVNIVAGAKVGGARQIILHGSIGAGDSSATLANFDRLSDGMKKLMAAKTAAEEAVSASGIHYTIIRNGRLLRYGTPASGNAELYEDSATIGAVTRQGLARLTAECLLNAACFDRTYHAIDKSLN